MSNVYNKLGDEKFTLNGTDYNFLFPDGGGHQGFVSASPFAPKQQVGERTYNDYTAYSVVAFTDLSSGMGQERIGDATKYYDAQNIDARSGRIVLGPYLYTTTANGQTNFAGYGSPPSLVAYGPIKTEQHAFAAQVTGAGQVARHIWVPLKGALWGKQATVELWSHNAGTGLPDTLLSSGPFNVEGINEYGGWAVGTLSPTYTLVDGTVYWVAVWVDELPATVSLPSDLLSWYCWYNNTYAGYDGISAKRFGSDSWFTLDGYAPIVWIPDDTSVALPPILFAGAGEDGVSRVWSIASRFLYYYDEASLPVPVDDAPGGDPKDLGGYAACAQFYKSDADTAPILYIGLGDAADIVSFNGSIGDEEWTATYTGIKAHAMCLHDNLLWLANDRNKVQGWNATTLGNEVEVGDSAYIIRNMVSWNGYLWVGKDDGLYRVVVPDTYPTTGDLQAQKVIDYAPLAAPENFSAMCVHQGELFFSLQHGVMRYTTGGVLTPISPDIGLELSADIRATCRALATTLTSLWALFEAPYEGYSALLAYNDGAWHPLVLPGSGALVRSLLVEPGWYGDMPRIWFSNTLCTSYINMPFGTQRRWLWDDADFSNVGVFYTSWIDGGLRTVLKDWVSIEFDAYIPDSAISVIGVSYRLSEGAAWIQLATNVEATGVTKLSFPSNTYGNKVQLRFMLSGDQFAGISTDSPRIEAAILRYMERPDDIQQFTRTYELSSNQTWRNGVRVQDDLATRLGWIRTLRESAEPLTWVDWTGTSRTTHWVDYNAAENPEVRGDMDTGTITLTVRLQIV